MTTMEVKLLKPILLDNGKVGVVGKLATVSEQRARELIRKGYAAAIGESDAEKPAPPPDDKKALELENLRARAAELGIANAGRLGEAKLRERIQAAEKKASGQPDGDGAQPDEQLKLAEELGIENAAELEPEALATAIEEKQKAAE